jgi:EAL domain-containing protein (putative c-di-GMP-specific phosphodiesterase class I)/CheY-like chemotaxis protein
MVTPSAPIGRAISVVVADDEPHIVTYLEAVLQLEGFVVAGTASDVDSVVQQVHRMHPDVVLLDLHMPGGGLTAAQLIGSLSPETRILIFSAETQQPEILPLLRSGIDGYVVKGCSAEQLAAAIRSAVAGDKYFAPEVNKVAIGALTDRLHAEQHADLKLRRERERIGDVIAERRFRAVHQPILDLRTGTTMAVEALSRFTAIPPRPPDEWFAEADRVGMRVSLELATASAALVDLTLLRPDLSLTLNISPAAAVSGRLSEVLLGAPLPRIILELTEHAPVSDYPALNAALAPWRDQGARLAVDDAGSGYSSFAHILSLSPEFIKFDVNLTREIHLDKPRQALARALVSFATEMDVGVIAEGIETEAQLKVVAELGTPYAQGFHLGRPRPLAEQPDLLAGAQPEAQPERAHDQRDATAADGPVRRGGADLR